MANVEINGLQAMMKKLESLGKNVDKIVDNSISESAGQVKRETEKNIQNVGAVDTGRLLRSITVEKLGMCRYAVGTGVEYAPYVEFGTGSKGDPAVAHNVSDMTVSKTGKRKGKLVHFAPQAPRPFLRPAFDTKREVVTMNIKRAILSAATETTGGGE